MEKEKLWKSPAVFTYPPPPLHPTFLSFPSPRWADPWLSPTEKSRSLIIPTERVAKANLARGNGDPVPFPNLPISSLSFSFSICVCVCIQSCSAWPPGSNGKACGTRGVIRCLSLSLFSLSLSLFFHAYHCCHVKLCETTILVISMFGTEVRTFTRSSTGWEMLMPWREAAPLFMAFLDKKSLIWGIICLCVWLSLSVQTWSPATNCLECWLSFPFGTVGGRLI